MQKKSTLTHTKRSRARPFGFVSFYVKEEKGRKRNFQQELRWHSSRGAGSKLGVKTRRSELLLLFSFLFPPFLFPAFRVWMVRHNFPSVREKTLLGEGEVVGMRASPACRIVEWQ